MHDLPGSIPAWLQSLEIFWVPLSYGAALLAIGPVVAQPASTAFHVNSDSQGAPKVAVDQVEGIADGPVRHCGPVGMSSLVSSCS